MIVKVLSLLQPWAELVVIGAKKMETRGWNTTFRGELYIHSSGRFSFNDLELCRQDMHFKKYIPDPTKLICGAIIGKVCVDNSMLLNEAGAKNMAALHMDEELAFGDYRPGRFAWMLSNPVKFDEPIPAKGQLGIWSYEMKEVTHA